MCSFPYFLLFLILIFNAHLNIPIIYSQFFLFLKPGNSFIFFGHSNTVIKQMFVNIKNNQSSKQECPITQISRSFLNLKQESNTTQNPLASLLLRLEVESPDKCWSALFCLVDRTLIDVPHVLSVDRNGLQEDDRQWWSQILQSGFIDHTCLHVPSSSLHEQSMYVGTCKWNKQLENTT